MGQKDHSIRPASEPRPSAVFTPFEYEENCCSRRHATGTDKFVYTFVSCLSSACLISSFRLDSSITSLSQLITTTRSRFLWMPRLLVRSTGLKLSYLPIMAFDNFGSFAALPTTYVYDSHPHRSSGSFFPTCSTVFCRRVRFDWDHCNRF